MLKITSIAVIGALAIAPAAFAKGHSNGNNANAQAMVANINAYGGGLAKELAPGGAAEQEPSNRGWGNAGSAATGSGAVDDLLGTDVGTSGGQVSKRNK